MFEMSVSLSVCLSRGSSRLRCAKTAEQIKMLFMVNTVGGPWNIVLDVGPDSPPTERGRGPDLNFAKLGLYTESGLGHVT